MNKKYSLDESFFKSIDSESKAYALGFLLTDGHVRNDGNAFSFHSTDRDVVEKLKVFLKYTGPLLLTRRWKTYHKPCWRLEISRGSMVKDLSELGVQNNKLNNPWIDLHNSTLQWHFIRGLMDGDGSFGFYESQGKGISSVVFKFISISLLLVEGLRNFFCSEGFDTKVVVYCNGNYKPIYKILFSGSKAVDLLDRIYLVSEIFMERKKSSYLELKGHKFLTIEESIRISRKTFSFLRNYKQSRTGLKYRKRTSRAAFYA